MHKNKSHHNNKFQNHKRINNPHKFCKISHNSGQFNIDTISFQASQQVKAGNEILLIGNTTKVFLSKTGEKYTLQKKSNIPSNAPKTQDVAKNEVMETIIMTNDSDTDCTEPVHKATDEQDLLNLFDQYCNLSLTLN